MHPSLKYVVLPRQRNNLRSSSSSVTSHLQRNHHPLHHGRHFYRGREESSRHSTLSLDENRNSLRTHNAAELLAEAFPDFSRYHIYSAASVVPESSYEAVGRQRHLMASKAAMIIPPVSTILCIIFVLLYLFRHKLNVKEEDVCVSWGLVMEKKQYWRLFIAQFFHFNRLNVIVNSFTLFTVGRYLERKVSKLAMLMVVIVMSVLAHFIYIVINPMFCSKPHSELVSGFGNIIYSLRVLLAYALEPRNYERDLVFGLYPMVVSASHAPWQPILDLIIFKLVLPEQCITGQLSGIAAGFIVTAILLLWPTKGIYIASPPYYWTFMGSDGDPNSRNNTDTGEDDDETWQIQTFKNSDFWFPTSLNGLASLTPLPSTTSKNTFTSIDTDEPLEKKSSKVNIQQVQIGNSLERRSDELKSKVSQFFAHPTSSIMKIMGQEEDRKKRKTRKSKSRRRRDKKRMDERDDKTHEESPEIVELHRRERTSENEKQSTRLSSNSNFNLPSCETMKHRFNLGTKDIKQVLDSEIEHRSLNIVGDEGDTTFR